MPDYSSTACRRENGDVTSKQNNRPRQIETYVFLPFISYYQTIQHSINPYYRDYETVWRRIQWTLQILHEQVNKWIKNCYTKPVPEDEWTKKKKNRWKGMVSTPPWCLPFKKKYLINYEWYLIVLQISMESHCIIRTELSKQSSSCCHLHSSREGCYIRRHIIIYVLPSEYASHRLFVFLLVEKWKYWRGTFKVQSKCSYIWCHIFT